MILKSTVSTASHCHRDIQCPRCPLKYVQISAGSVWHSPFNAGNEEDKVAVDFGAVDKFINVACVHRLSCLQAARPYAITHW